MQTTDAVVRLKTLAGKWETCGTDRLRGIVPEGISLTSNSYGPDTASFSLKRDPSAIWPDLQAFTPVEIEIGGIVVWDGFINQTPTTDSDGGSVAVQCKGWQYHLDDDSVEKVWVHSSLPAWRDITSFANANLSSFPTNTATSVNDGTIALGWSNNSQAVLNTFSAVVLDLGPDNNATGLSVTWEVPKNTAGQMVTSPNMLVYGRANSDVAKMASVSNDAWSASNMKAAGATCNLSGAFPVASRYVMVGMAFVGATNNLALGNYTIKIKDITVTTDPAVVRTAPAYPQFPIPVGTVTNAGSGTTATATFTTTGAHGFAVGDYVSIASVTPVAYTGTYQVSAVTSTTFTVYTTTTGNITAAGVVNKAVRMTALGNGGVVASDVVKTAIKSAPLLSTATNNVTSTSFSIPTFGSIDGAQTPRQYIDAANSYHDYVVKLNPGDKTLVFKPRPSTPSIQIGRWGGATFEDAAAASSEEIYNKVIVEGDGPDGSKLRVTRFAGMQPTALAKTAIPSTIYNGAFASTNYWAATDSNALATAATPVIGSAQPSLKWTPANNTTYATLYTATTTTGTTEGMVSGYTFKAGTTYTVSFNLASYFAYFPTVGWFPSIKFGSSSTSDYASSPGGSDFTGNMPTPNTVASVRSMSLSWTPLSDISSANVSVKLGNVWSLDYTSTGDFYLVDDVNITASTATLVDEYKFFRTKILQVNGPMTTATGQQLGDTFLRTHMTTPLKGNVAISPGGARDYLGGNSIHPSQLLLEVGEKIHLSHRIDPDTGSQGRDGDIAQVSYDHATQTAQLSIDNQRNRFEALLARLAVVTNNRLGR